VVLGAGANIDAQAARFGLLIAREPEEPEHERILASSKSNLGPPLPALRCRIAPRTPGSAVPAVEWLGPCDYTAATLLGQGSEPVSGEAGSGSGRTSAVDEAAAWLRAQLAAGPRPAAELQHLAQADGIGESTLRRARERLAVRVRHAGFQHGGTWVWESSHDVAAEMRVAHGDAHVFATHISDISSISVLNSGLAPVPALPSTGEDPEVYGGGGGLGGMWRTGNAGGEPAGSGILHGDVGDAGDAHLADVSISAENAHLRAQETRQICDDGTEAGE
jgi:hypothetical protein